MKRMLSVLIGVLYASSALASSPPNCDIATPPLAAGVTADHGFFFYVFPREIGVAYTGCQTMWDEKGKVWFALIFQRGGLIQYAEGFSEGGNLPLTCQYRKELLISNSSDKCPQYSSLKNGFKSIDKHDEPTIPEGRDPRR